MKNGIKDMDELVPQTKIIHVKQNKSWNKKILFIPYFFQLSLITDVPALDLVLQQLDSLENLSDITDILDLLFYVLVRLKEPSLKTMPQEAVSFETL